VRNRITSDADHFRIAGLLTGRRSAREIVLPEVESWLKWHQHDYPSKIARWNHHPEFEIHLIDRGAGRVIVGDYVGEFTDGHFALIGPNIPHHWISSVPKGTKLTNRDTVLQFDGESLCNALKFLPEIAELEHLFTLASRGLEFTGETRRAAAIQLMNIGEARGIERLSRLFALFSLLARAPKSESSPLASEWFSRHLDASAAPIVDRILKYIMANLDGQVRMSAAARIAGMSEPTFSKFFKRVSGRGFVEMVRTMRIVHACRLLRQTTQQVSDICFEVGFRNLANFNRQFLKEMKMNPSAYRRTHTPA